MPDAATGSCARSPAIRFPTRLRLNWARVPSAKAPCNASATLVRASCSPPTTAFSRRKREPPSDRRFSASTRCCCGDIARERSLSPLCLRDATRGCLPLFEADRIDRLAVRLEEKSSVSRAPSGTTVASTRYRSARSSILKVSNEFPRNSRGSGAISSVSGKSSGRISYSENAVSDDRQYCGSVIKRASFIKMHPGPAKSTRQQFFHLFPGHRSRRTHAHAAILVLQEPCLADTDKLKQHVMLDSNIRNGPGVNSFDSGMIMMLTGASPFGRIIQS